MKNLHLIAIYFLIVLSSFLFACGAEKQTEKAAQTLSVEEVKITKNKKRVVLSPKNEQLTQGELVLEVAYPQFKLGDSTQNIEGLNKMIKTLIDTTIARHFSQGQGLSAEADEKNDTVRVKAEEISMYSSNAAAASRGLYIAYKIHKQAPDYVEIEFGFNEYTGGAHGMNYTSTIHYDVANKKDLAFADLFASNSSFLNQISQTTINELMAKKDQIGTDSSFVYAGAGAKEENFRNFLTTNDSLRLLFDPYAVAPYAAGPQVIKIPFSKLESILNKNCIALKSK